jgi:XTP/dITP diphosphohydrolase
MMMKLVFATNNKHKLTEIQQIVAGNIQIQSLTELGCFDEIPETQATIAGNASQKAWYIFNKYNCNCFADDTGLEIDFLDGRPGVYSARYAGEGRSFEDNIQKVLEEMKHTTDRRARFLTVISLIIDGRETQFEGYVEGNILEKPIGTGGFGYDAIFQPIGFEESFAQMSAQLKNLISHRGMAVKKLTDYLKDRSL